MAIYTFSLAVGYKLGGMDYAQGYRARMLRGFSQPIYYIFMDLPGRREVCIYKGIGIPVVQMVSIHQYFTDNRTLNLAVKTKDKLEELKKILYYTTAEYHGKEVWLIKEGFVIASILLDEEDEDYFYAIRYFNHGNLIRMENYTEGISYVDYYVTATSEQGAYAKLVRRTFYNRDGSSAYDEIFEDEKEWYVFPDGRVYTKQQFIVEFIKKLNLSKQDIVLLDRSVLFGFMQPLFQFGNKARFIAVIHAGHYFETGEDPSALYLNWQYYYWFKYSKIIDTMVVSTQKQKDELIEKLQEYECHVPNVEVIPAGGIGHLRYPAGKRKPYSLVSVSRLNPQKKVDWIIRSVVKAHEINPSILLDIYGSGKNDYIYFLQNIVCENHAQDYICFKGHMDVTEIYRDYEVFIAASTMETLGLSVMEAIGSGAAVIGLDVKYGNRLFVRPGQNGYLVDYNHVGIDVDENKLIDGMAERIVEIFEDEERLEEFHRVSYEIAKNFSTEIIREKWEKLLN